MYPFRGAQLGPSVRIQDSIPYINPDADLAKSNKHSPSLPKYSPSPPDSPIYKTSLLFNEPCDDFLALPFSTSPCLTLQVAIVHKSDINATTSSFIPNVYKHRQFPNASFLGSP